VSRDERDFTGLGRLHRLLTDVEPKTAFAFFGVRTMAVEALVRKDRPDITVKLDSGQGRGCSEGGGKERDNELRRKHAPKKRFMRLILLDFHAAPALRIMP
jgi:hypothetical protein